MYNTCNGKSEVSTHYKVADTGNEEAHGTDDGGENKQSWHQQPEGVGVCSCENCVNYLQKGVDSQHVDEESDNVVPPDEMEVVQQRSNVPLTTAMCKREEKEGKKGKLNWCTGEEVLRSLNISSSVLASTARILHQEYEEGDGSGILVKDNSGLANMAAECVLAGRQWSAE